MLLWGEGRFKTAISINETEIGKRLGITKQAVGQKKFALLYKLKEDEKFKEMLLNWFF